MADRSSDPGAYARRRGGRAERVVRRARQTVEATADFCRKIPTYEVLNEEALSRLERHADWLLREVGIEFHGDEESLRLFKEAGATVLAHRVRFDPGHVRAMCATAPSTFQMHGRAAHFIVTPHRWLTACGVDQVVLSDALLQAERPLAAG